MTLCLDHSNSESSAELWKRAGKNREEFRQETFTYGQREMKSERDRQPEVCRDLLNKGTFWERCDHERSDPKRDRDKHRRLRKKS